MNLTTPIRRHRSAAGRLAADIAAMREQIARLKDQVKEARKIARDERIRAQRALDSAADARRARDAARRQQKIAQRATPEPVA